MIYVNDQYDLIPDLFVAFPEFVKSSQAAVEILPPGCVESFQSSNQLTVFVQPEPDMNYAPKAYARQIAARPNNIFAVSGFCDQCDWKLDRWVLYLANLTMTARVNHHIEPVDLGPKDYFATALLGGWMINRGLIVKELQNHNLLSQCLVNYYTRAQMPAVQKQQWRLQHTESAFNYRSPELDQLDHPTFLQLAFKNNADNDIESRQLDTCQPLPNLQPWQHGWISQLIPRRIYNSAYISIVAETECLPCPNAFFVSEKITKPLIMGHPFVIFGCQHYLKHLRSLGLKTFSPWLNESYDDIENATQRAKALVQSVVEFSQLSELEKIQAVAEMKTVTDHNRSLVLDSKWNLHNLVHSIKAVLRPE
jgi:hypothetical protein